MIWPFIFLSYSSLFVFGLSENVRGPLFPDILKHFNVNDSTGSLMFALGNLSGLLSSYSSHYFLKRYDRLTVLRGAVITLIASMWGMAASPVFPVFLFFSFLFGFSLGIIGLVPNILVPMGSTPHKKQQMLSGLHTMYGMASLLAPLLAAFIQYLLGNWRFTFAIGSLAPIALLVYTFHSSHKDLHTKADLPAETHKSNRKINLKPQLFLSLMLSFGVAVEIMVSSRLALYMQRVWQFNMETSSFYVTFFFISMMVGRLLFAVVHIRKSIQFMLTTSLALTGFCILGGIFIHPLFLAAVGFTIAPFYPLTITWVSSEFPDDLDTAVVYTQVVDSVMLIIMHLVIGKITDIFNIKYAILFGVTFVLASIALVNTYHYFFKRSHQRA